ncbi:MAG: hypothetical protein OEV55_05035 [candidate division Zixibacteria bacterium]|nr:hypothetical protein [candidate division Zixibacteria bacterium]
MGEILVKCSWCGGTGRGGESGPLCMICKGSGLVKVKADDYNTPVRCNKCKGTGKDIEAVNPCIECGGSGWAGRIHRTKKPDLDSKNI